MPGTPSFTAAPLRSPTQSNPYPPHSPTGKTRPYFNTEQYQALSQTPPAPLSGTLASSPHMAQRSAVRSPPPALNGHTAHPLDGNHTHQANATSPPYQLQRTYSGQLVATSNGPAFNSNVSSHGPTSSRHSSMHRSPIMEHHSDPRMSVNGLSAPDSTAAPAPQPTAQEKPARPNDPMSFASILSEPVAQAPASRMSPSPMKTSRRTTASAKASPIKLEKHKDSTEERPMSSITPVGIVNGVAKPVNGEAATSNGWAAPLPKPRRVLTACENDKVAKALAEINEAELSDLETAEFESERRRYQEKTKKRVLEVSEVEMTKRKRRRIHFLAHIESSFASGLAGASDRFRTKHEGAAQSEVHEQEIQDEKERKKDMQRKRRREHAIKVETQKMQEAQAKAELAADADQREHYRKEAERSFKKIRQTQALERGERLEELPEANSQAPNLEGGITSTFHIQTPASPEPLKRKGKPQAGPVTRPKKSKEKKQAEKDAAEAAYAEMEKEQLVRIAPKEDPRREAIKKESRISRSKEPTPVMRIANYDSKGYAQIYDQIWRDIARKDIPRVHRIKNASLSTKQENMRKTAILAAKQARKWQERTNKSMKDTQARAKRVMREMNSFWKRNEREERDLRRMAERKEIEDAKKAEADREASRQKRKLNFLISQTELYSHFIGRKIKTDEVERATDDPEVAISQEKLQLGKPNAHTVDLPTSVSDLSSKVKDFNDLDFDAEDETALKEAAAANAQHAIQEAQDKARAFNNDQIAAFDDGELNFRHDTDVGSLSITQPRMLQGQLKEYQLKGLNWLVNLYEQGINGILADEMGLGKTIQSIAVMGYLAERYDIWGPFLVIAPSSTLHNWQQEITRFVPSIKVLPYWGSAKDRKVLRKFWDRKHITYNKNSEFHVLVTSYQLVVHDAQYFQKVKWQYMILDEAQAIKSSQSSRWKVLLSFHCRNRLLLTGTPIQNNMQELWALLHFIMPTLFDSHDEFSDWFSKDIESHAQSNTKLNQDQLRRLHMILKPFMLRRVKAHVQKELGDKVEKDVFCELTYRQRAYYSNLRSKISIMDLIEKATIGDDQDTATLMNLVMQFRKVCNHPDLFERADTASPYSQSYFAETASFLREGRHIQIGYSIRNMIQYDLPRMLCSSAGRLAASGPDNTRAGFETRHLGQMMNIWTADYIKESSMRNTAFSFLRLAGTSLGGARDSSRLGIFERAVKLSEQSASSTSPAGILFDGEPAVADKTHDLLKIVEANPRKVLAEIDPESHIHSLMNISKSALDQTGYDTLEPAARPKATAPPIQISCSDQTSITERHSTIFNVRARNALFPLSPQYEEAVVDENIDPCLLPAHNLLPLPASQKARYTNISVPSMRRFVTDSGKLAKLDQLLRELKNGGHRVLLYFQMTRMIDLMEEYLTYRNYKYCRLDGSTKLEDRRDTVHDFQTRPEIFIFLLSTRAGGLGINLTSADTVIFYDSDWNPTIDSQAMDRAHRLGQTKQVTVYRLITRGTIEERIRKRALQKEEVQKVVISGGASGGVDFNTRNRENRREDIAMWLADDDQAALIEQKAREAAEKPAEEESKAKKSKKTAAGVTKRKRGEVSMDDMYHEGEGHFEDASAKPSGAATPVPTPEEAVPAGKKRPRGGKGISKKAKTVQERLRVIDAEGDLGMGGT